MPAVTPLPEKFGRYRIIRQLGAGGMGTVYLAHDTELDRDVALKVPHFTADDGPEIVERFKREARIAAATHHSNVCAVFDVGEIDGVHYLTMPYIEGVPLSQRVGKPWPPPEAVALTSRLAGVLAVLHRRNLMHRDLKPANIMLRPGDDPVVMDFGLARSASGTDRMTATGAAVGTPAYMSPEQIKGDPDRVGPATDIFSLGIIFYELLTGQSPFPGPGHVCCYHIVHEEPARPSQARPGLDPALDALCLKALEKNPAQRYASMADFAAALDAYRRQAAGNLGAETLVKNGGPGETLVKPPAPETDLMPVPCPHCGKRLQVPASLWGKTVRCPQCKTTFPVIDVPTLTPSPAPLTAAELVTPPPSSHETVRIDPPARSGLPSLLGGAALATLCIGAGVGLAVAWHDFRAKARDEPVVAQLPVEPPKPAPPKQEDPPQEPPPPRRAEPEDEPAELIPPPSPVEPKAVPQLPVEPKEDPPRPPEPPPPKPDEVKPPPEPKPVPEKPQPPVPEPTPVPEKREPPPEPKPVIKKHEPPPPEPERVPVVSAGVHDAAGLFSAESVKFANARIRSIHHLYRTPVVVETVPKVPGDPSALNAAERRKQIARLAREWAEESRLDGVYVLICRRPGYVQIVLGPETQKKAFTPADRNDLLEVILTAMRADERDDALAKGLDLIVHRLKANREPAAKAPPAHPRPAPVARPNRK